MKTAVLPTAVLFVLLLSSSTFVSASPSDNTWTSKASMPKSDYGLRAAVVDGRIFVMGGSINQEYDPANDSWTTKTAMPTPRNGFSITVCEGKIYTFGGRYGQDACSIVEVYDPITDSWSSLAPMPVNASNINSEVVNGKIYLIGLPDSRIHFSLNLAYDVATNSWTNRTTMPTPVNAYASAVLDGKIYVFGGFDDTLGTTRTCNQTQIYDPDADSWMLGSPVPGPVLGIAACTTTGIAAPKRIYVFGGLNGINGVNTTQVYNPTDDSWSFGTLMPTARAYPTVAAVDGQIYVLGGSAYLVFCPPLTENQQYTPDGYGTPDSPTPSLTEPPMYSEFPLLLIVLAVVAVAACGAVFYFKKKR